MSPGEKCIVPYCDVAEESGAKPIYIRITVDGKRILKKVGALCEVHLPDLDTGDSTSSMMHWIVYTPADDVNFIDTLRKGSLPFLRQALERLEDELRRGFPHKTRINKVAARIRALEKELLKKDAESNYESSHGSIVDQVLPRKKKDAKLSTEDWREISELGKKVLPGKTIVWDGERVHCHRCEADIRPVYDHWGNAWCTRCEARVNPKTDRVVK